MEKTTINKIIELLNTMESIKENEIEYENTRSQISDMFDSIAITYCNHTGIEYIIQKNVCDTARTILHFLKIRNFDNNILLNFIDILIDYKININYLNNFIFSVIKDLNIEDAEPILNLTIKKLCFIACHYDHYDVNENELIFNKIVDIFSNTTKHFKNNTTIIQNVFNSILDNKSYFKDNELLSIKYNNICKKIETLYYEEILCSETLKTIKLDYNQQELKQTVRSNIKNKKVTNTNTKKELENEEEWITPKKYNKYDRKRKNIKKKYTTKLTIKEKAIINTEQEETKSIINRKDNFKQQEQQYENKTTKQNTIQNTIITITKTAENSNAYNTLINIQNASINIDETTNQKKEEVLEYNCCALL